MKVVQSDDDFLNIEIGITQFKIFIKSVFLVNYCEMYLYNTFGGYSSYY